MVNAVTGAGGVAILDLHWSDDDTEQQNMPKKEGEAGAVVFWESIAETFKDNDHVFYELYNEPHDNSEWCYLHGCDEYEGMLPMIEAVRRHAKDGVLVIAGAQDYAYDTDSLVSLDSHLGEEKLVMYNFHPYMGEYQAGDTKKTP